MTEQKRYLITSELNQNGNERMTEFNPYYREKQNDVY